MSVSSRALYITMFFIFINIGSALTLLLVEDADGNKFFADVPQSYDYQGKDDVLYTLNITTSELGDEIQASGELEDKGDQIYRVLDVMGLGFVIKFFDFIETYMYGIISMLQAIIGPYLDEDISKLIFGTLRWAMTILYIIAFITIITGKVIAPEYNR